MFPVCVTTKIKAKNYFVLRVFLSMRHQLGTEVADGKEVICAFNQQSVLLIKHWQTVETQRR